MKEETIKMESIEDE